MVRGKPWLGHKVALFVLAALWLVMTGLASVGACIDEIPIGYEKADDFPTSRVYSL